VDDQVRDLMTEEARWQAPESLTVERGGLVGLTIGDSEALNSMVSQAFAGAPKAEQPVATKAGKVQVNPDVRVTLRAANRDDADIDPSGPRNASTSSQVAMLWMFSVTPKQIPSQGLLLTAHVEVTVPGDDFTPSHDFTFDFSKAIPVKRTLQYTLKQVVAYWQAIFGTGIGASAIAVTVWLAKRRRREANESVTPTASDPVPQVEKATPRG
jgi:hypothetical protein